MRGNTLTGNRDGIKISRGDDNVLENNDVSGNNDDGIEVNDADRTTVRGNTVTGHGDNTPTDGPAGITFFGTSADNLVYDNVLRNVENVHFGGNFAGNANAWNASKSSGPNVIGGPTLGGNYYAKPDGTGFSQTCDDLDGDGICDSANGFGTGSDDNTDFLPLTVPGRPDVAVSPTNVDAGVVTVGDTASETVTVSNTGNATLSVTGTALGGADAGAFGVTDGGSFSLGPGDSRAVTVEFAPSTVEACGKQATLSVASDDPDESSVAVALAGTARPAAVGSFPAPTDPDGDCRYENVNGQNGFGVVDVQALFANRESLETRSDRAAFNFNGDTDDQGDPKVNIVDVQRLFVEELAS
ncbi:hypothetical protein BRC90_05385 [Halobacteriales archaeon QS_4_69_34]|nr:MAG: hypothetical protein BRC90_05385 [Halobacteriales archaeon QS_4_69_34]